MQKNSFITLILFIGLLCTGMCQQISGGKIETRIQLVLHNQFSGIANAEVTLDGETISVVGVQGVRLFSFSRPLVPGVPHLLEVDKDSGIAFSYAIIAQGHAIYSGKQPGATAFINDRNAGIRSHSFVLADSNAEGTVGGLPLGMDGEPRIADLEWLASLGQARNGLHAGYLAIRDDVITADTATRANLAACLSPSAIAEFELVYTDEDLDGFPESLRQIHTGSTLVDITDLSGGGYRIDYREGGTRTGTTGSFTPAGATLVSYEVTLTASSRLSIVRSEPGTARTVTSVFEHFPQPTGDVEWELNRTGGGYSKTTRVERTATTVGFDRLWIQSYATAPGGNPAQGREFRTLRKYRELAALDGFQPRPKVIEETLDVGTVGAEQTTKYAYYDEVSPTRRTLYGMLRAKLGPYGEWEFYTYYNFGLVDENPSPGASIYGDPFYGLWKYALDTGWYEILHPVSLVSGSLKFVYKTGDDSFPFDLNQGAEQFSAATVPHDWVQQVNAIGFDWDEVTPMTLTMYQDRSGSNNPTTRKTRLVKNVAPMKTVVPLSHSGSTSSDFVQVTRDYYNAAYNGNTLINAAAATPAMAMSGMLVPSKHDPAFDARKAFKPWFTVSRDNAKTAFGYSPVANYGGIADAWCELEVSGTQKKAKSNHTIAIIPTGRFSYTQRTFLLEQTSPMLEGPGVSYPSSARNSSYNDLIPRLFSPVGMSHSFASSGSATFTVDDLNLIPGKSTKILRVYDAAGRLRFRESWAWLGGAGWKLLKLETFTNDAFGRVTQISEQRGTGAPSRISYQATYDGLVLKTSTDTTGVKMTYSHDGLGRIAGYSIGSADGSGVIPGSGATSLASEVYLDCLDQVIETRLGGSGGQVISAALLDSTGRPLTTTDSDQLVTTYSYSVQSGSGLRTDVARPGGITETHLFSKEGRLLSSSGSGMVSRSYEHGYDFASGSNAHTLLTKLGTANQNAPRTSAKWDWFGQLTHASSNTAATADFETSNTYDPNSARLLYGVSTEVSETGGSTSLSRRVIHQYDDFGARIASGIDVNSNGSLADNSSDLITRNDATFVFDGGEVHLESVTKGYPADNNAAAVTVTTRSKLTGLGANVLADITTTDANANATHKLVTCDSGKAHVTAATTLADGTGIGSVSSMGFQREATNREGGTTSYEYDALGRLSLIATSGGEREMATRIEREAGRARISGFRTDLDGSGAGTGRFYGLGYDAAGRMNLVTQPDGKESRTEFNARGQTVKRWGSATVPEWFEYDADYGWLVKHHTWQTLAGATPDLGAASSPPAGSTVTLYVRDEKTGKVFQETTAHGTPAARTRVFTYDALGQLRTFFEPSSAAGQGLAATPAVTTTYSYHPKTGRMTSVDYSDSTTDLAFTHTRAGMLATVTEKPSGSSQITRTFHYDLSGNGASSLQKLHEDLPGYYSTIPNLATNDTSHTATRIAYGTSTTPMNARLSGISLGTPSSTPGALAATRMATGYTYGGSLLDAIGFGGSSVSYDYETASSWVKTKTSAPSLHETITRFPHRDSIRETTTATGTTEITSHEYGLDANGRRDWIKKTGGLFEGYGGGLFEELGYDGPGRLQSSVSHAGDSPDASTVPGRSFTYQSDDAGNLRKSERPDAPDGAAASVFTPDARNGIASRTNSPWREVAGIAPEWWNLALRDPVSSEVTRFERSGGYFHAWKELAGSGVRKKDFDFFAADRRSGNPDPLNPGMKLDRVAQEPMTLHARPATETLVYDARGNLRSDALWSYTWDGANRLTGMESSAGAIAAGIAPVKLAFRYDWLGRRYAKEKFTWNGTAFAAQPGNVTLYWWDGWNILREAAYTVTWSGANPSGAVFLHETHYHWGPDLSGSLQGAGGTGGLVASVRREAGQAAAAPRFPAYDGNGNIVAMLDASGAVKAAFEYDPYGRTLRASGPEAGQHLMRFATRLFEAETGLCYHQFRYYSPETGRFLSRDPAGPAGNANPYGYAANDPAGAIDSFGLAVTFNLTNRGGRGGSSLSSDGGSSGGGISIYAGSGNSFHGASRPRGGGIPGAVSPTVNQGAFLGTGNQDSHGPTGLTGTGYPSGSYADRFIRTVAYGSPQASDPSFSHSKLIAIGRGAFDLDRKLKSDALMLDTFDTSKTPMYFGRMKDAYQDLGPGFEHLADYAGDAKSSLNEAAMDYKTVAAPFEMAAFVTQPETLLFKAGGALLAGIKGISYADDVVRVGMNATDKLAGSGPARGIIEVSELRASTKAFENYNPSKAVEFIFDTKNQRFVVGNGSQKHFQLRDSIGASSEDVVGGMFRRSDNGSIILNEHSGTFWQNWDTIPGVRNQLIDFLGSQTGQKVINVGF